jgi:hypothetical protein
MESPNRPRTRRARALATLGGLLLGWSATAPAYEGNFFVVQCAHCATIADFATAGLEHARAAMVPGTYVVVSESHARSAYVRVTGQAGTWCDIDYYGECYPTLFNAYGEAVTETGSALIETGQLERIDEALFAINRYQRIEPVMLPSLYQTSFIHSLDEEIGPGITYVLSQRGINVFNLRMGTRVLVRFPDGTSALFEKVSQTTVMWRWSGMAWDRYGRPIHRNGALQDGWIVPGLFGGRADVAGVSNWDIDNSSLPGVDLRFSLVPAENCRIITVVHVNGRLSSSYITWHRC